MDPKEYIRQTAVTDAKDYSHIQDRLATEDNAKLFHYLIGIGTEAGELQDALKKTVVYGKPLDRVNLKEEVGDVCWYLARLLDHLGSSFEEVMEININKLRARYGEKFSEYAALNRNLENERKVLENGEQKGGTP